MSSDNADIAPPSNIASVTLRFGDWGPGYLAQDTDAHFGTVVLRPGDDFGNHYHEHHVESFLVVSGSAEIWFNRSERMLLQPGDFISAPIGVQHYLRNTGSTHFRAFFVKAPGVPSDKVDVPWLPHETDGAEA